MKTTTPKSNYRKEDLVKALHQAGLASGQVVFCHSNIGFFGIPAEGNRKETAHRVVLNAFLEVLGPGGTLVVPTFTYSFCKGELFDPDHTPSTCGEWTEFVRQLPGACRSQDPIFSVAAIGARASELTTDAPEECFGPNSFWERFYNADGIICNLNVWVISTFIHFIERRLKVPYRYNKLFPGVFFLKGAYRKGAAIYFCQDLSNPSTRVATEKFDQLALNRSLACKIPVGRGYLTAMPAKAVEKLIQETLPSNPWFLTAAGETGVPPVLCRPGRTFPVALPSQATMRQTIEALAPLPRDIVSDGYDAALGALAKQVPMTVHEYPTGTACWTWIIPEKWTCHEAYLETMDGRTLFSYADNPLHVVSYSLPFAGVVTREQLLGHLHTHPLIPEAIPFKFKYYERDWGLCCSHKLRDSLQDAEYRVVIRSDFSFGTLKVGECVLPGQSEESVVLCTHLCHPAQTNDDLTGVVVGIEVMRRLRQRVGHYYTYRLLILPETIGSVAWLSHNDALIPKLKGGLFLEMLGRDFAPTLQYSFAGSTEVDLCFRQAMRRSNPQTQFIPFMTMNDERQFNAPGVRVPMLALYRILPSGHPDWPYREYHSNFDTPSLVTESALAEAADMVLAMVDTLEQNVVPVNQFKGEVFLSRYGLHVDWYEDREANRQLFNILYRLDGKSSIAEIAENLNISFKTVRAVVERLQEKGLVSFRRASIA